MDPASPLTHLEARVLAAIERHIRAEGVAPTIAELAANLRLKSKGTVHRYVQSLITKGRLERHGNGWRGLRIVGLAMPDRPSNVQRFPAPVRAGTLSHLNRDTADSDRSNVGQPEDLPDKTVAFTRGDFRIPLLGRIAAGQPIEAIEDSNYLDLAEFFVGPDRYALRVTGESMVDAGILDGDTVILRKQDTARRGDIVVALIDGQEATLKRLGRTDNDQVELIPENSAMKPMHYAANRVSFQGVLVGQLRSY
ncbi:MAG: transcriptional repressor LexA [Granulosicoccus sp.]|nr:transcriptional repressor LexA [Granulosicoccus sp.]